MGHRIDENQVALMWMESAGIITVFLLFSKPPRVSATGGLWLKCARIYGAPVGDPELQELLRRTNIQFQYVSQGLEEQGAEREERD